jgi:D-amino-acid dehydrogenase
VTGKDEIVVVGGGVIGVSCAYYLARASRRVRLVERGDLCSGSSYGNARWVPPSRSLPLSVPGVIGKTLRGLLDPHGPFRVTPRLDRELAEWLWRFRSACHPDEVRRTTALTLELTRKSLELYEELADRDGLAFGFRRNGVLVLYRSETGQTGSLADAETMRTYGVASEHLDGEAVRRLEPRVAPAVAGGVLYPEDADVDPPRLVRELAARAEEAGARIETGTEVVRLRREGRTITEIETNRGSLVPDLVVLANGAWAARTVAPLGVRLPIQPAKGYGVSLATGGGGGTTPLLFAEAKTTLTPAGERSWVTGKLDLVGFDESNGGRRVAAIPQAVRDYLELDRDVNELERWYGYRPLTPDGLPIVGVHPAAENLILAAGHGRLGLALAPVTGALVSQLAAGLEPSIDLEPLRPDRFERKRA